MAFVPGKIVTDLQPIASANGADPWSLGSKAYAGTIAGLVLGATQELRIISAEMMQSTGLIFA
jgi:hypothetical protein